jgi:hypothetical protein
MLSFPRIVPLSLCLVGLTPACDGLVGGSEGEPLAFSAEAEDLWELLVPDPEGQGLLSPIFEAQDLEFDRVGVRFDATDLKIEARVRAGADADWSDWLRVDVILREDVFHEGGVDLPRGGAHLQLRLGGEAADAASYLEVLGFNSHGDEIPMTPIAVLKFTMPVGQGGVVLNDNERHFGACRSSSGGSNSDCTRKHLGVDVHGRIGKPILAAADGVVVARSSNSGAGLYLDVQHASGYMTRYLHLDRTRGVSVGSSVAGGQRIADLGQTGRAGSGPHLHLEVRRWGQPIDPAPLIGWHGLPRVSAAPSGRISEGSGGETGGSTGGTLKPGDSGTDVYRLQHLLEAWRPGILEGSLGGVHTATYGPRTLAAVHEAARELRGHANPSDDYTVGPLFWAALSKAVYDRFSGSRRIRYGDAGPDVYRLQHALEAWRPGVMGGSLGSESTAKYGPRTREAVHAAARALRGHANPSDDYTVGPLFWAALLGAI